MNARSRLLALVLSILFLAICSSAFSQNEGTDEAADLMRTDHIYKYSNGPNPEDTYYVVRMTDGTLTFYTGPAHNIFEIINQRGSEYKRPKVTIKDGGLYFRDVGAFGRLNARIINSNSIIPGYSGLVIQYHYDTKHISSFALTGEHAIYYRNLADKHQQALVAEADRKAMQEEEERAAESRKKAEQTAAEQNTFFAKLISGRLSEALAMLLGDRFCAWMAAGAIFLAIANYPPWRVIKPDLHQGQVIQWNDARGFGFISPQDSSGKVFFHASSLQDRKNPPNAGSTVYYVAGQPKPGNNHDDDDDESERHLEARIVTYQPMHASCLCPGSLPGFLVLVGIIALVSVLYSGHWISNWFCPIVILASFATFCAYGDDKTAALEGAWRTSEGDLHLMEFFFGWPGALVAQSYFNHKRRKASFMIPFWLIVILNVSFVSVLAIPAARSKAFDIIVSLLVLFR